MTETKLATSVNGEGALGAESVAARAQSVGSPQGRARGICQRLGRPRARGAPESEGEAVKPRFGDKPIPEPEPIPG